MEFCDESGRGDAKLNPKRMKQANQLRQLYEVCVEILEAAEQGDCTRLPETTRRIFQKSRDATPSTAIPTIAANGSRNTSMLERARCWSPGLAARRISIKT